MFVKICGVTRREDAEAAVAEGASAIGFVFWPRSPRFIEPSRAREIAAALPPSIEAVGVFVNQSVDHVNEVSSLVGLTRVQLHGDEEAGMAAALTRPVIKAVSVRDGDSGALLWPEPALLLVDAVDPVRRGGTGRSADWVAAAALSKRRRVLLAGGLRPDNVADAIARVAPFGIDVSSGVERSPGIKDRRRLASLFEAIATARKGDEHTK